MKQQNNFNKNDGISKKKHTFATSYYNSQSRRMKKLFLFIYLLIPLLASAQDVRTVEAEYVYNVPEDVSLAEAKKRVLDYAKIQAIADAYGTVVSQTNTTTMTNRNGVSSVDFLSIGGSDVKGEWIETIGQPEYQTNLISGELIVSVRVKGKICELITNAVDFKVKVLRNGTEDRFESEKFNNGDHFYLSFTSPIAGYLAIYLVDVGNDAICLLPYQGQQNGIYTIKANQRYVFFSTEDATPVEKPLVDLYNMTALYPVEQNQVYVIFSPQPFVKATDSSGAGELRQLKGEDFQKWLAKCRKRDVNMTVKMIPISVWK